MAKHLNVCLLVVASPPRRLFYAEKVRDTPEPGAARPTRVARWYRGIRARWSRSQGKTARTGRKVWEWLHARTHPDEPLYAKLRNARTIDLSFPAELAVGDARTAWNRFLAAGQWRHVPWFLLNAAIAPLTLIIALLPGPNLVGYWFVYRAFHHLFILIGVSRARMGWVETRFQAVDVLDRPIDAAADPFAEAERLALIGLVKRPRKLGDFLGRQGLGGHPARSGSPVS